MSVSSTTAAAAAPTTVTTTAAVAPETGRVTRAVPPMATGVTNQVDRLSRVINPLPTAFHDIHKGPMPKALRKDYNFTKEPNSLYTNRLSDFQSSTSRVADQFIITYGTDGLDISGFNPVTRGGIPTVMNYSEESKS